MDTIKNLIEVFNDYRGRRKGLLKALTTDANDFFEQCDPNKQNLCLYGFPDGTWEVNLPGEYLPPHLPEPSLGINFARDALKTDDWLSRVARHCDAWLLSIAFLYGARLQFGKKERMMLFDLINSRPSIFETVSKTPIPLPAQEMVTCGACRTDSDKDGFWICCDVCAIWYHGHCVNVTPSLANSIELFQCCNCKTKM